MHICLFVCMRVYLYMCLYVHMYVGIHAYIHTCMFIFTYTCKHYIPCICTSICECVYIHIYLKYSLDFCSKQMDSFHCLHWEFPRYLLFSKRTADQHYTFPIPSCLNFSTYYFVTLLMYFPIWNSREKLVCVKGQRRIAKKVMNSFWPGVSQQKPAQTLLIWIEDFQCERSKNQVWFLTQETMPFTRRHGINSTL